MSESKRTIQGQNLTVPVQADADELVRALSVHANSQIYALTEADWLRLRDADVRGPMWYTFLGALISHMVQIGSDVFLGRLNWTPFPGDLWWAYTLWLAVAAVLATS